MPTDSHNNGTQRQWVRFASTGSQMLGAIAASVLLGMWVDKKTGTRIPWCSMAFPVLTVIGLLIRLIKETRPQNDAYKTEKRNKG